MLASLVKRLCCKPQNQGRKPYLSRAKRLPSNSSLGGVQRELSFFGLYFFLQIWNSAAYGRKHFIASGFFAAFGACNELSGILLGLFIFAALLRRHPRRTLSYFASAAAVPCLAFLITHYIALGSLIPAYFGTLTYYYPSSYWLAPQGLDAIREAKTIYLFNMTFGHHGILSLTPIFLFSFYAIERGWRTNTPSLRLLSVIAAMTTVDSLLIYRESSLNTTTFSRGRTSFLPFGFRPAWLSCS